MGASAWATEGDIIYSNDFSTNDQTNFATWTATGKKPSGYSYAQIGRGGSFSIDTGALVWSASTGGKNNSGSVANAAVGVFNSEITTATQSNYVLEFDVTIAVEHINKDYFYEISDEDKKVIICIYGSHTRSGSSAGSTVYGYIVGGDNGFQVVEAGATGSTNAEGTIGNGTKVPLTSSISETTGSKTYHVKLDAKTTLGTATLTIKEGETTLVDDASVNINPNKGLKYMCFEGLNNYGSPSSVTLDNLSIVEGAASLEATADFTVKYVATINDEETEIKDQVVRTGVVDATVSLLDEDKNAIWYNDKKYLYSSDDASTSTIADDNSTVVKVVFAEAPTYTYSVQDNLGNTLASGTAFQGEDVNFYVPYYAFKDSKFYSSPSLSSGTLSYGSSKIAAIATNTDITVTYTEEVSSNVVFYAEAENLTGITVQDDGYTQIRMSNGKAGYYGSQTAFTSLPAGVYTITAATRVGTTKFYIGSVGEGKEVYELSASGAVTTTTSSEFVVPTTSDVYTSTGSASAYFDYVIIRKIDDLPATETIKVTSAGMATYVSNYNLDFSSATTKAYKVSVADKGVATLVEVSKVPAKTPVLLYVAGGNGDGEAISVTTDAVDAVTGNDLVAGTGAAVASNQTIDEVDYTNMILNNIDGNVGFYFANGQTVATYRAYLHIASTLAPDAEAEGGEARMSFVFDDETTGINTAKGSQFTVNGEYYNLRGQRVAQPTKGLYIVNGKKVVIK